MTVYVPTLSLVLLEVSVSLSSNLQGTLWHYYKLTSPPEILILSIRRILHKTLYSTQTSRPPVLDLVQRNSLSIWKWFKVWSRRVSSDCVLWNWLIGDRIRYWEGDLERNFPDIGNGIYNLFPYMGLEDHNNPGRRLYHDYKSLGLMVVSYYLTPVTLRVPYTPENQGKEEGDLRNTGRCLVHQ